MRILLTNDDGIYAEGLACLERIARTMSDDVWVVAPETDQSGFAHSLSLSEPLRMRRIDDRHYALRGTPTDCVIMGVRKLMPGVAGPDPVGRELWLERCGRYHLFRHRRRRDGGYASRRSIDRGQSGIQRSEPGACRALRDDRGVGSAALRQTALGRPAARSFSERQFSELPTRRGRGRGRDQSGKYVHGLWVEERADGRGFPYYWLRFGRQTAEMKPGTDMAAGQRKAYLGDAAEARSDRA